jgi:hypothetical protein
MEEAYNSQISSISKEWRRVSSDLPVTFVWAYDTAAILLDYHDSESGILQEGQLIKFSGVVEDPCHYLCDLDDPSYVEKAALPTGRIQRFRPWCFATRLQVVLAADLYRNLTVSAERPSWTKRLLRRIKQ